MKRVCSFLKLLYVECRADYEDFGTIFDSQMCAGGEGADHCNVSNKTKT